MNWLLIYAGVAVAMFSAATVLAYAIEDDEDERMKGVAGGLICAVVWPLGLPYILCVLLGSAIREHGKS